jgi:hypothetical protein
MQCNIGARADSRDARGNAGRFWEMAKIESPESVEDQDGQPPAAWVWSQYRGVTQDEASAGRASAAPAAKSGVLGLGLGLGLAAAALVVCGLTWLFTTQPAPGPIAPAPPVAVESPAPSEPSAASQKIETAPPAAAPAPVSPAATPAAPAPKPSEPAPARKKKKPRH